MIILMYVSCLTFPIHIIHDFITQKMFGDKLKLWRFSFVSYLDLTF
jgi:hypothetical protein